MTSDEHVLISDQEIYAEIPLEWRFFVAIYPKVLRSAMPVVRSLHSAISIIASISKPTKKCVVIIGRSPFQVDVGIGDLQFTSAARTVNGYVENLIFIDVEKTSALAESVRVATILEEFVHVLMNISDEDAVSRVVAAIYPGIIWDGTNYLENPGPNLLTRLPPE